MKVNSMNPKTVAVCLAVVIFASVLAASAILTTGESGTSEVTVFLVPSCANVRVNQTFAVSINVSGVSDLYGWEFKLGYNASLLDTVTINEGSFLNSSRDTYFVPKVMSADGYILAGCTSLRNVNGVDGNGTLATIEFRTKTLGSCTLDLYDTKLVNSAKQLVEHNEVDGAVTVSGCITVTVQYADGFPRSDANVWIYLPTYKEIGTTGEDGKVANCNLGLSEGTYWIKAYWPSGTQFGRNTELYVDSNGNGSAIIQANYEITPPTIEILSPQNHTYTSNSVPLTFTLYDYSPISWISYSLDNQPNTTITGNTTLTVEDGTHRIVVYANDSFGNMGCSQIVHFTIGEHDIAVANITVSKTIVGQGYSTSIKVIVENQGDFTETFNITAYANTTIIATLLTNITLASGNSTTITFTWNTTGFAKGNYTISAYAWPVPGETDTGDNRHTDGWILITKAGDFGTVSGGYYAFDDKCDYQDVFLFGKAYVEQYHPLCDFDNDGDVDYLDVFELGKCYINP